MRSIRFENTIGSQQHLGCTAGGGAEEQAVHRCCLLLLYYSPSLLLSSLKSRYTKVYEPQIRALLGTTSHFFEVVVLKLRTVPIRQVGVLKSKLYIVGGVDKRRERVLF